MSDTNQHLLPRSRKWRMVVGFVIAGLIGSVLGTLNAPLWTGFVAVPLICFTVLPWAMFGEVRS